MSDPTPEEQERARAFCVRWASVLPAPGPTRTKIENAIATAFAEQRGRWESVVPEHVGQWADAIVKEPGFDGSAPLIVMLRQLAAIRQGEKKPCPCTTTTPCSSTCPCGSPVQSGICGVCFG